MEEGLGPGRGWGLGGRAAGLRPRLSGGGRELCSGRGSSKWRHVDPRRNRAVVVPEDISHPVPAHWLRGATFTHTPAPASAPSRRRHSKGQPRRPARPQSLLQPGRRHAGRLRARSGHREVSLSSFKETLTLRLFPPPSPPPPEATSPSRRLGSLRELSPSPSGEEEERCKLTRPHGVSVESEWQAFRFDSASISVLPSRLLRPPHPPQCPGGKGGGGGAGAGGKGEREVRWEGYWFILCLLD